MMIREIDQTIGQVAQDVSGVQGHDDVVAQVEASIQNTEVASIALRYLQAARKTDIQTLLVQPRTQQLVIDQIKRISDRAHRSLVSALIEGPERVHAINGTQARVDALGDELFQANSPLVVEHTYKTVQDKDYMADEIAFHNKRWGSGDSRWLVWNADDPQHKEAATAILKDAKTKEEQLGAFLAKVQEKAALPEGSVINTSYRVKGVDSLFNKIAKFRTTPWGKQATIANAVDLLGGRIVVSDLKSLEAVMLSVEAVLKDESGLQMLRKENKFAVNHKTTDPYRAIHYVIALPGEGNHSLELQLSTFPALLGGELAHDAIYKPYILDLPSELQEVVRDYNWESDEQELMEYLGKTTKVVAELSTDQKVERAIEDLDYNAFYDLVLSKIDLHKPLDDQTKAVLKRFHEKEVGKLEAVRVTDESFIIELAQAAHNGYYRKNAQHLFMNLASDQFGATLPSGALRFLPPGGLSRYQKRYEEFDGTNNKLSIEDLGLHTLSDEELEEFFSAAYKDLSIDDTRAQALYKKIRSLQGDDEQSAAKRKELFVMNLNHAPFERLFALTQDDNPNAIQNPDARKIFRDTLIAGQLKAIATASILTEIGDYDEMGNARDLSREALPGTGYTMREALTHIFFITVNRPSSETAGLSFADFATAENMQWARDNDKAVDQGILSTLVAKQADVISRTLVSEENTVLVARLQKARYEIVGKYIGAFVKDQDLAGKIARYIGKRSKEEIIALLNGGEQAQDVLKKVKDPVAFTAFTNFLTFEASLPNIFVKS